MSNRFTERAQRVILIAQEEAKRLNHDYVGTEHLLLGLIALGEGVAAQVLANLGVDLRRVRNEIEKIVGTGDNVMLLGEIPFTPRAKKVLELAVEEAQNMGHNYVGTEHLLLGLIREEEGVAARVLENLDILVVLREAVPEALVRLRELLHAALVLDNLPRAVLGLLRRGADHLARVAERVGNDALAQRRVDALQIRGRRGRRGRGLLRLRHALLDRVETLADALRELAQILTQRIPELLELAGLLRFLILI
jgi:hypothetical protein